MRRRLRATSASFVSAACFILPALTAAADLAEAAPPRRLEADLLVVGGNESAAAAAVQACRLGVRNVVLVNDGRWLGGQFSSEGVGAVDEWTTVDGKRTEFPRSGMFMEIANAIEDVNRRKYGVAHPGGCYCARLTIEPAEAAAIFERLVAPQVEAGRLRIERGFVPFAAKLDGRRLAEVHFERGEERLEVAARLTIDAGDWGDVVRLSGARWSAGPDPKSRFDEPSAPEVVDEANRREMNPLTWCVVLQGAAEERAVPPPDGFEPRNFQGASRETRAAFAALGWPKGTLFMGVPAFADARHEAGPYSPPVNVYTHRRLVDAAHRGLPHANEKLFLNWPVQDYPLDRWPQRVVDELETAEPGSSAKNLVELTPKLRAVVFADAKRHALGLLHHLQTVEPRFRRLELSEEFGTPDRLPPKPYVREGLRLEALAMLKEQDVRTERTEPRWAKRTPDDAVFGFQFNIDFHPTRRIFLKDDPSGPWATIHTATRNWNTHTDRGTFPLRGLVPVERDGLLGSSKNIGVSSIVQSSLRLHGQMTLCGQASGTVAWACLQGDVSPRALAADGKRVRQVQQALVRGADGPGVLLWPYHDLPPSHPAFAAASLLAVAGVWPADAESVFFRPDGPVSAEAWAAALARVPDGAFVSAAARERLGNMKKPPATRGEAVRTLAEGIVFEAFPLQSP